MLFMINQKLSKGKLSHFAKDDKTLCGISLGVGSGLTRDGEYGHRMCSICSLRQITGERKN